MGLPQKSPNCHSDKLPCYPNFPSYWLPPHLTGLIRRLSPRHSRAVEEALRKYEVREALYFPEVMGGKLARRP